MGLKIFLKVSLLLFFTQGCASMSNLPEQKTVPHVDLQRYMGDWHVITAIPTAFDGTYNPVEHYSWNEKEQRVDIDYSYNKNSLNGPVKHITQKGFIDNKETNADWKIQVWWPFKLVKRHVCRDKSSICETSTNSEVRHERPPTYLYRCSSGLSSSCRYGRP
jgi:lipocalin